MALHHNPRIVTNGLVLALDAGDINSYPGSGTSVLNLLGTGSNGTLTNGATFSTDNRGVFVFDGIDDYLVASSPSSYSEYTFSFFCKWLTSVTYNRIFGLSAYGTYTVLTPSNVGFHYNPLGGSPPSVTLSSGVNVGIGQWCQIAVTVSPANSLVAIYINGILRNSWSTLPSGNFTGSLYLGAQNTLGLTSNCNVANFQLYNRPLFDSEILQNFNSQKKRFGL